MSNEFQTTPLANLDSGNFIWSTTMVDMMKVGRSWADDLAQVDSNMDSTDSQLAGFDLTSSASDWTEALWQSRGRDENSRILEEEEGDDMISSRLMNCHKDKEQEIQGDYWSTSPKSFFTGGAMESCFGQTKPEFRSMDQSKTAKCAPNFCCQGLSTINSSCSYVHPSTIIQSSVEPNHHDHQHHHTSLFNNPALSKPPSMAADYEKTYPHELSPTSFSKFSSSPHLNASLTNKTFSDHHRSYYDRQSQDISFSSSSSSSAQFLAPVVEEKAFLPKSSSNSVGDFGSFATKSAIEEPGCKRPRIETPLTLPTFKVRKDKLVDRVTALQQLVSPFGKTDTASVLHEAIEYIKLLHEEIRLLSTPYMKYRDPLQGPNRQKDEARTSTTRHELRSRGLCLVPIHCASLLPAANEAALDFWAYRHMDRFDSIPGYGEASPETREEVPTKRNTMLF